MKTKERGSVAVIVTITILFIIILLSSFLIYTSARRRAQLEETQKISNSYDGNLEEVYNEKLSKLNNITMVKGAPIPQGFYYVGGTLDTGIVISDNVSDNVRYENSTTVGTDLAGNQFVWVPVEDISLMYKEVSEGEDVKLSGTNVTVDGYSLQRIRPNDNVVGVPPGNSEKNEVREPDIIETYDLLEENYKDILGYNSVEEMAQDMVDEYNEMIESIKNYGGFYVGRYELTGTLEKPTERPGTVVMTQDLNVYSLKKACKNLVNNEYTKSTMIYGCQWDEIMNWLVNTGSKTESEINVDSSSWGNYNPGTKQETGSNNKYMVNNIYDLAGNHWEFTQEVRSNNWVVLRGGSYQYSGTDRPAAYRGNNTPVYSSEKDTTRPVLIIK